MKERLLISSQVKHCKALGLPVPCLTSGHLLRSHCQARPRQRQVRRLYGWPLSVSPFFNPLVTVFEVPSARHKSSTKPNSLGCSCTDPEPRLDNLQTGTMPRIAEAAEALLGTFSELKPGPTQTDFQVFGSFGSWHDASDTAAVAACNHKVRTKLPVISCTAKLPRCVRSKSCETGAWGGVAVERMRTDEKLMYISMLPGFDWGWVKRAPDLLVLKKPSL